MQKGYLCVCRTASQGRGGPDAGRLSVCVGRQDGGGEDLMQEGYLCVYVGKTGEGRTWCRKVICVCRTARQGRGGPDAGRVYVCVGRQDEGGEDLMQEGYLCV